MTKPEVTIPDTPPPADLVIEDLVVGDGPEATPGQPVEVHYVGVAWSTGREFDASWDRGGSFGFRLGAGQRTERQRDRREVLHVTRRDASAPRLHPPAGRVDREHFDRTR